MEKLKSVFSKFFKPPLLFSTTDDTNKRKRSESIEENDSDNNQQHLGTTIHEQHPQNNEVEIIDDEDNHRDFTENEQQKKRRRTAHYQPFCTTNSSYESDNRFVYPKNRSSLSNYRRFGSPSYFDNFTFNYDPSKSILFSDNTRRTSTERTNLQSNDRPVEYLLANSLSTRPSRSKTNNPPLQPTLTNPTAMNKTRFSENEKHIFPVNSTKANSSRLPYLERLRQRTLEGGVRMNETLDTEQTSVPIMEAESKSKRTSTDTENMRAKVIECGIQCDMPAVENQDRDTNVALPSSISTVETNQSLSQPTENIPLLNSIKPKVLSDVTPFSWPKFARAQEQYAKTYVEKCADAAPSKPINAALNEQSHVTVPAISMPSKWKCPTCTKENSAQALSCSLCRGTNVNNKNINNPIETVLPNAASKETSPLKSTIIIGEKMTTKDNSMVPTVTTTTSPALISIAPKSIQTNSGDFGIRTSSTATVLENSGQIIAQSKDTPIPNTSNLFKFGTATSNISATPMSSASSLLYGPTTRNVTNLHTLPSVWTSTVTMPSQTTVGGFNFGTASSRAENKTSYGINISPQSSQLFPSTTSESTFGIAPTTNTPLISSGSEATATSFQPPTILSSGFSFTTSLFGIDPYPRTDEAPISFDSANDTSNAFNDNNRNSSSAARLVIKAKRFRK